MRIPLRAGGWRPARGRTLKRSGIAGIALGALALIACEVPLVLAFVGIGGLGAGSAFGPSGMLEMGGLALAAMGAGLLIMLKIRRVRAKRREAPP